MVHMCWNFDSVNVIGTYCVASSVLSIQVPPFCIGCLCKCLSVAKNKLHITLLWAFESFWFLVSFYTHHKRNYPLLIQRYRGFLYFSVIMFFILWPISKSGKLGLCWPHTMWWEAYCFWPCFLRLTKLQTILNGTWKLPSIYFN